MTYLKSIVLLAASAVALLAPAINAAPIVFNASESARPSEVIGLQGASFGPNPQVLFTRVTGSEGTITPNVLLTVVNKTGDYVSAVIPSSESFGLYAVQVQDGTQKSQIVYVNRAWSWSYDHHDEVFLGATLRLWGRNLFLAGATPQVRFVHPTTSASTTASVNTGASDAYVLQVTVPTSLSPDVQYRVFVRNGFGGNWGETEVEQRITTRTLSDPFGLGETWGRHFTFAGNVYNIKTDPRLALKAQGNGVANDQPAVQAAIDRANADGGGVVYFPAGTYLINNPTPTTQRTLYLRSNVVLDGDGTNATILKWGGVKSSGDLYFFEVGDVFRAGFQDLKIDSSGFVGFLAAHGWNGGEQFFKNCSIDGQLYIPWKNRFVMRGCYVQCMYPAWSFAFFGHRYAVFKQNHFYYVDGRIHFNLGSAGAHDVLWENSRVTRDPVKTVPGDFNEYGGLEVSSLWNFTLLNSTFDQVGTQTIPDANDTETILNQDAGGDNQKFGNVSSATATTVTDNSAGFPTYSSPQGYIVSIVSGPGSGQFSWVTANTATTLTVSPAWAVVPTSASKYAVTTMGGRNWLVKGNTLNNRGCRGIWLYSTTHYNMNIVNNRVSDCDGIDVLQFYMAPGAPYTPRFNTSFGLYVADNIAENLNNTRHPVRIGIHVNHVSSTVNFGTAAFVPEFRRNTVNAYTPNNRTGLEGEGYWCTVIRDGGGWFPSDDAATVGILGAIFDGNTALDTQDAYRLSKGVFHTAIYNRTNINVANEVLDFGSVGTVKGTGLQPPAGGTGLRGDYFDNIDLTGFKLARTDATVNFDWGSGSPDAAVAADTFSARWTGVVQPEFSQTYTFYTVTDDGVRLWVNNTLLIDKWVDQGTTEWSGTIALTAGQKYSIRMEYFENLGGASAKLLWSSPSTTKSIIPQTRLFPSGTFQQSTASDGIVSMEGEHYTANVSQGGKSWSVVSPAGFSGDCALQALPNTGANVDTGYVSGSPRLDYRINFTKTGTHYVWIRGKGATGSDDSLHAGLNGAAVTTADRITGFGTAWTWSKSTMDTAVATINITSTGIHTLNIWMREDGAELDKIVLTTNSGYTPTGSGPTESARQ